MWRKTRKPDRCCGENHRQGNSAHSELAEEFHSTRVHTLVGFGHGGYLGNEQRLGVYATSGRVVQLQVLANDLIVGGAGGLILEAMAQLREA